jgi:hypothetical protein
MIACNRWEGSLLDMDWPERLENVRTACNLFSSCVIIQSSMHVSKQVRICSEAR